MRALAAFAATLVACGGPQIQQRSVGGADMAKFLPATLETEKPREGDPREVKVRVWTDAGIRALPRWKDDINEQIDYANQLLTPLTGVRMQVEAWKEWTRAGEPHQALAQLAEADKGDGVVWVIGYIGAPATASKASAELGLAEPLGKHVVVRGYNEKAEADALAGSLPDLKETERNELIAAHRRHKQTVILLRALAVTLGGIAETDPAWILHPSYSKKQTGFSERNRELFTISLDARIAEDNPQTTAKKLLEAIEKTQWGGWIESSHDEVTKRMRNVLDQGRAGKTAVDVPPAAYDQFSRIQTLAKQGKTADALIELENLLTAYPGNAAMFVLRCEILLRDPKGLEKARAACKRVSEVAPGDPSPHLAVGEALLRAGDVKAARAELSIAEGKVDNLPSGREEAWRRLIAQYQAMGALSWTEEAIARAKLENDPVAIEIAKERARYGVAKGSKIVPPEQEAALVESVKRAIAAINASKYGEAEKVLRAAEKKWPGASGIAGARCNLYMQLGQVPAAKAACAKAIAADPKASWALYLGAILDLRAANGTQTGIEKLKRAIEADPDLAQAWRALAKAYARAKDKPALQKLAADYQAKFGQPLPP